MTSRASHRRLARFAGLAVLIWAGSGLIHPALSLLGPRPAQFAPPPSEAIAIPPALWAQATAVDGPVTGARMLRVGDQRGLQVWRAALAPAGYFGFTAPAEVERAHAIALARHYSGAQEPVRAVQRVDQFSLAYPAINRLLPVWRVDFDRSDGLQVHVETSEDRLGAISDRRRRVLLTVFQQLHTLRAVEAWPWLRLPLIMLLVGGVLLMSLLGLRLALLPGGRTPLRRGHRLLGLVVATPLLMWSASGLFHLIQQQAQSTFDDGPAALASLPAQLPVNTTRLLSLAGEPVFGLADGTYRLAGESWQAAPLAALWAGAAPGSQAERVTGFGPEYGFANKRLPVWRVPMGDGQLRFVDLAAGRLAAQVGPVDIGELWTFSTLHKWGFADALGRLWRDGLMSLAAALGLVLVGLGWRLRRRTAQR